MLSKIQYKSEIRETLNLLPCADSSTDTKNSEKNLSFVTCYVSLVTCYVSPVTCHLSPVTYHLNTTLCTFSCYESPQRLCADAAAGGLVIDRGDRQIHLND